MQYIMEVGSVSLDLTLIMHEQAFGDYLTDHSFLCLESVGYRTSQRLVSTQAPSARIRFHPKTISFSMKTQRLHCIYTSFSYRFQPSTRKRWKRLKTIKTNRNLFFACQDNLNNL